MFDESDETVKAMWNMDALVVKFDSLEPNEKGQTMVSQTIKNNYRVLKEIYQFTRARSESYPYVDLDAFYETVELLGLTKITKDKLN